MKKAGSTSGFASLLAPPSQHYRAAAIPALSTVDSTAAALAPPAPMVALSAKHRNVHDNDEPANDMSAHNTLDDVTSNNSTTSTSSSTTSTVTISSTSNSTMRSVRSTKHKHNDSSVRVAVRIRPLLPKEIAANERASVERSGNSITIAATDKRFTFDHVFPVSATQSALYDEALQPLMDAFLQGFNVTVIAYGQTGSGKTFTMGNSIAASATSLLTTRLFATSASPAAAAQPPLSTNDDQVLLQDNEGLIPRFLHELFGRLRINDKDNEAERASSDCVSVSFLEIYGEDIHDLLLSGNNSNGQRLQLRESSTGVYVQGLTEVRVANRTDALEQMRVGSLRRATGSTEMNEHSSRSHAVYTVKIVQRMRQQQPLGNKANESNSSSQSDATIVSKLTFVDLAGSERLKRTLAEGSRMKEGIQINVGLLALGNVINALGDSQTTPTHVPYRSSKLTRLLADALGGNSRTLFIACVSPADVNASETLSTLHYANRAKNIQNNAVKNIDSRSAEVLGIRAINALMRRELVKAQFVSVEDSKRLTPVALEALVDELLKDPAVQRYVQALEQLALDAGADIDTLDAADVVMLADLAARVGANQANATTEETRAPVAVPSQLQPQTPAPLLSAAPTPQSIDDTNSSERNVTNNDNITSELTAQVALWQQKSEASALEVAQLQQAQFDLQAQVAASTTENERLQSRIALLEASAAIASSKQDAFEMLDHCQDVWNELGLSVEEQTAKLNAINALLLQQCAQELEGLEAARAKLQLRIDVAATSVQLLERLLSVNARIDISQLQTLAGPTLLAQEKFLLLKQTQMETERQRRVGLRVDNLRRLSGIAQQMELLRASDLRHVQLQSIDDNAIDIAAWCATTDALEATGGRVDDTETDLDVLSKRLALEAIAQDERLLATLTDERAQRMTEAQSERQAIRSVTTQMQFSADDVLYVVQQTALATQAPTSSSRNDTMDDNVDDEMLQRVVLWLLDDDHSDDNNNVLSTHLLDLLVSVRRSANAICDGRTNAIAYLYSTLDEALDVARATLGDAASTDDARALLLNSRDETDDDVDENARANGSSVDALATGAARLAALGEPIEASLRALLLSMDSDFTAFGIETDAQRISFFLGSSDCDANGDSDNNNATRKTLERYIAGDRTSNDCKIESVAVAPSPTSRSFLSPDDPAFAAFGAIYSAAHSQQTLARLRDAIVDVRIVQQTLESAQRRLESLQKIMKLFAEISEFKKKIGDFETHASQKDRLFGSSLRLLEEEKFRKLAAKRYPSLLAALRKEVAKWLTNDDNEFNLSVLGKDLKNLLLDMMNTDTGLMHLDLGVVDPSRSTVRRSSSKTALTPSTPGSSSNSHHHAAAMHVHASAPARSRSMTAGLARDAASAKKRLAFEH